MVLTQVVLGTLDALLACHLPKLAKHFNDEGVIGGMFATGW
jgi:hypothetical protein